MFGLSVASVVVQEGLEQDLSDVTAELVKSAPRGSQPKIVTLKNLAML